MNTHETYVSLETAKLLKQAGFDWECPNMYLFTVRGHEIHGMYKGWMPSEKDMWCPTLAVAQRWLREIYGCYVEARVDVDENESMDCIVISPFFVHYVFNGGEYDNKTQFVLKDENGCTKLWEFYEDALDEGISFCAKFILDKKITLH